MRAGADWKEVERSCFKSGPMITKSRTVTIEHQKRPKSRRIRVEPPDWSRRGVFDL